MPKFESQEILDVEVISIGSFLFDSSNAANESIDSFEVVLLLVTATAFTDAELTICNKFSPHRFNLWSFAMKKENANAKANAQIFHFLCLLGGTREAGHKREEEMKHPYNSGMSHPSVGRSL